MIQMDPCNLDLTLVPPPRLLHPIGVIEVDLVVFPMEDGHASLNISMGDIEVHVEGLLGFTYDRLFLDGSKSPYDDDEIPPLVCEDCLRFKASKSKHSASSSEVSFRNCVLNLII